MFTKECKYIFLIIVIFIAACIETDIYLPAFPDMMAFFSVSEDKIQSLLTWNFIGICISGLFYGPISDSIGRKKPLMIALSLFLIGSVMTIFAESFAGMLWGRALQGLGSGGCFTLGTAIIFDAFQAEDAIRALSKINSIAPFIMAAAPALGGYLNYFYGFRSNFLAIAIFVLLSFLTCLFFLEETHEKDKRTPFCTKKLFTDFKIALTSIPFWQLTIVVSILFSGFIAFLSTTSVLFVLEFGVSKEAFPIFQAFLLGSWLVASLINNRMLDRYGISKLKQIGTGLIVIGGCSFIATTFLSPKNPYMLTFSMMIYTFGTNWTQGLYFPEVMEIYPDIKGIIASLLTSIRLLLTAMIVGLSGFLYDFTIIPVTMIIACIILIVSSIIFFYERKKNIIISKRIS